MEGGKQMKEEVREKIAEIIGCWYSDFAVTRDIADAILAGWVKEVKK